MKKDICNIFVTFNGWEPGDERMAQIMREVAEDARESTRRAAERVAAGIEAATQAAQEKWGAINRIKNGGK